MSFRSITETFDGTSHRALAASPRMNTLSPVQEEVAIDYLANHPWCAAELAEYFYDHWREIYQRRGVTVTAVRKAIEERTNVGSLPLAIVALHNGQAVGTATIKLQDLDCRPQLTPWLAGVMVAPAFRRQGVATALIERIVEEARRLGLPRLYLWTPASEQMYARRGWSRLERLQYFDSEITIMDRDLDDPEDE
jgi:GNAT superfamily N-acetyltransferase